MDDKALSEHFDRVTARYAHGSSAGREGWESIPDDESDWQQNELTNEFRS